MKTIPVVRKILERNDATAADNRALFDRHGVRCVNILGGAGCGKTSLLQAVLPQLRDLRVAVLEGDPATTRDAERLAALGVPVVQLVTDGGCHLTASLVRRALDEIDLAALDLLLIENVGNPICPANFDLGEHARVAVLSVTEGDDKPAKYARLFVDVSLVVITKMDLLAQASFDLKRVREDIGHVNEKALVVAASIRGEQGIGRVAQWLRDEVARGSIRRVQPAACVGQMAQPRG